MLVLQTKGREWTDPATKKKLNFQQVLAILMDKAQQLEAKDRTRYLRVIGIMRRRGKFSSSHQERPCEETIVT